MTIENCKSTGHSTIPGEELFLFVDNMDHLDSHCMKNSWSYPADGLSLLRAALKTSVKLSVFLSYPFFFFYGFAKLSLTYSFNRRTLLFYSKRGDTAYISRWNRWYLGEKVGTWRVFASRHRIQLQVTNTNYNTIRK